MTQWSHSCFSASFENQAEPRLQQDPHLCPTSSPEASCFLIPYRFLLGDPPRQTPYTRSPVSSSASRGRYLRNLPNISTITAMLRRDFCCCSPRWMQENLYVSLNTLWFSSPVHLISLWKLVTVIASCTSFRLIHIKEEKPKENSGPMRCVGGNSISVLFLTQLLPFRVKLWQAHHISSSTII